MENNNSQGNTNTILIVVVLLIIVVLGVWWYMKSTATPVEDTSGINVDVTLPADGTSEEAVPATSGGPITE